MNSEGDGMARSPGGRRATVPRPGQGLASARVAGTGQPATAQPDPAALLRSRGYLAVLLIAALLGVPVSAAAYGFLALVSYLQKELFTRLPHGLGFASEPAWWPLPV